MELYLQMGYGMMEHARVLIDRWGGGTAVLSPRDLNPDQMLALSSDIRGISGGQVLLDPQLYVPRANRANLALHPHWPGEYDTGAFWQQDHCRATIKTLAEYNRRLGSTRIILPSLLTESISDDWLDLQECILDAAIGVPEASDAVLTIAMSSAALEDVEQIGLLVDRSASWHVSGYYVLCETPDNDDYLVTDQVWLANWLDMIAALKLQGAFMMLGHCSHQSLLAALTRTNAIASGTWLNVRHFDREKFWTSDDDEDLRRSTWYYSPDSLSEYQLTTLDTAYELGLLGHLRPGTIHASPECDALFAGPRPTATAFNGTSAFRHYLDSLHSQAASAVRDSYQDTRASLIGMLEAAEARSTELNRRRIRGLHRDFSKVASATLDAIEIFDSRYRGRMTRHWATL